MKNTNKGFVNKSTGWHDESKRHSLARQGIKTGGKITKVEQFAKDWNSIVTPAIQKVEEKKLTESIDKLAKNLDEGLLFEWVENNDSVIRTRLKDDDGWETMIVGLNSASGWLVLRIENDDSYGNLIETKVVGAKHFKKDVLGYILNELDTE